jgi:hypothetical protein
MTEEVKVLSASETKKEDWMNSKWRPMMGWMYMLVCMMDMVIFPILWSLLQTATKSPITQWMPLTLQGAGLFHIAMGAVLGIAAFGRTQEKLGGANNGGLQIPGTGFQGGTTAFGLPQSGFGTAPGTSYTPAPSWGTTPTAPRSFSSAPLGAAAVGAAGGFAATTMMPAMSKPMPSRPPFEEDFPELD